MTPFIIITLALTTIGAFTWLWAKWDSFDPSEIEEETWLR